MINIILAIIIFIINTYCLYSNMHRNSTILALVSAIAVICAIYSIFNSSKEYLDIRNYLKNKND